MTSHNLFDGYEPGLEYRSYFQYSRIPSASTDIDGPNPVAPKSGLKQLILFFIVATGYLFVIGTFPISGWFAIKRVKSLQRCLVYRLGERRQLKGPGLIFVLPCIDSVDFIDLEREQFSVVEKETFLISDGSLVEVQRFQVTISVSNAIKSFTRLKDSHQNVKEFIQLTFKNLMAGCKVDDFELKLDSIISSFASDCNFYLNNWGWHMDVVELPVVVIQSRAEQKNPIVSVLKSFFNQGTSTTNASQMLINSFCNGGPATAQNPSPNTHQCCATDQTQDFDAKFIERLERVPARYIHMNIFHYERFNIKITIGDRSAFFVYLVPEKKINKVDQIEEAIHFDIKCNTFGDFFLFTDHNDTSKMEITTKLF